MMIKLIMCDLDNTLLDFDKAEKVSVQLVLKQNGLPHDDATAALYSAVNQRYWERFEKGENLLITRMLPAFLLSTTLLDHRFSNFPLL